jgi:magnesium transporter
MADTQIHAARHRKIEWINIYNADEKLIRKVSDKFKFHELAVQDCLEEDERSKIDEYDDHLFVILHFPFINKRTGKYEAAKLSMFIGKNYFVTVSNGKLKTLDKIFVQMNENKSFRQEYFSKGSGYLLYHVMNDLFEDCFAPVGKISRIGREIEEDLFEGVIVKDMLYDIMNMKRGVIAMQRIFSPMRSIVLSLEHQHRRFLAKNLEVYFDNIVDKIEKLWSMVEGLKAVADTLQDANEALVSHNTNNVIKILTVFSVVMLPLTFLTGLYGMNLVLPLQEDPMAFWQVGGMMLAVVFTMLLFFRWKRWI